MVLYSGNVAHLNWVLSKEYVLFAQIVDADAKPLPNLLMVSGNSSDFNTTDDNGYIQANLLEYTDSIEFKDVTGQICTVTLNTAEIKAQDQNDLVVLSKPLVCNQDKQSKP